MGATPGFVRGPAGGSSYRRPCFPRPRARSRGLHASLKTKAKLSKGSGQVREVVQRPATGEHPAVEEEGKGINLNSRTIRNLLVELQDGVEAGQLDGEKSTSWDANQHVEVERVSLRGGGDRWGRRPHQGLG